MDGFLRQSTASQTRTIGPFIDSTDFITPDDGLTIANTDIRLKKNGAADVAKNSGGGTADVNGMYAVTWDATDTDTVGQLQFSVLVSGALLVWGTYTVLEEAVYDAMFAASAPGYVANAPVNVAQVDGDAGTAVAIANQQLVGAAVTGTLSTTQCTSDLTGLGDDLFNNKWRIVFISGPAYGHAAIVTDYVSASGLFTFSPAAPASIGNGDDFVIAPCVGGLAVGDRTGSLSGSVGSVTGAVGSVTGAVGSVTGNVGGNVTGSVGSVATGGITAASFAANAIDAAALAADAATEIATAVWASGTRTLTSFGTLVADTAAAVWAIATATLSSAGTIGKLIVDNLNATITSRASQTTADAIEADTQDLQTQVGVAGAGLTALGDTRIANLDATVSSRASQASVNDLPTNAELATALTNLDAAVSTRATAADVNAQVLDVLNVDTFGEPTGVPPATDTLVNKIGRVHMALRNEVTVDSNTGKKQFHDDAGNVAWEKDFTDAAGVYNESEGNAP